MRGGSGFALATRLEPSMPPAPPTFSTSTGWPSSTRKPSATIRAITSLDPPAAKGTINVIGRVGQSSARVAKVAASNAVTVPITASRQVAPLPGTAISLSRFNRLNCIWSPTSDRDPG